MQSSVEANKNDPWVHHGQHLASVREKARPSLGLVISDVDGTAYRIITQPHDSDNGGQQWVVAHNKEPFGVTITLPTQELSKWASKEIFAILLIDDKRVRDTWIPLNGHMDEEQIVCSWSNHRESP